MHLGHNSWPRFTCLSSPAYPHLPILTCLCPSSLQVALGITTLLTYVPVSLGAAHQGGAMVGSTSG